MAKKIVQVPFRSPTQQVTEDYYNHGFSKPNYEFNAALQYNGFSKGRSSLHIHWKDVKTNITYVSSMALLDESMTKSKGSAIINGKFAIVGNFTFIKRGTSVFLIRKDE